MSTPPTITTTRALAELAERWEHARETLVRIQRADGTTIEGRLMSVEPTQLALIDSTTHAPVEVSAGDLVALDVRSARRDREFMLACAAIVGATVALTGYATLPWVDRAHGGVTNGFMMLYWITAALFPVLLARTRLHKWLTEWRPLFPPRGD